MQYIGDIASVITIITAVWSIWNYLHVKKLTQQIINHSVSNIIDDLRKIQTEFNDIYYVSDKAQVSEILKNISVLVDRLYFAYKQIDDKTMLNKIKTVNEKIRKTQQFAGSLDSHTGIVSELNTALQELY